VRLTWLTDTHLEFPGNSGRLRLAEEIRLQKPNNVLITGDISNAKQIKKLLPELQERIGVPIFYVLGNHDFYGGSIKEIREWAAKETIASGGKLFWMHGNFIQMNPYASLIAVDGWADGLLGDPAGSRIILNDWTMIDEMRNAGIQKDLDKRLAMLKKLGHEEASTLGPILAQALAQSEHVYVMTHIPPWRAATWHEGEHSDNDWLPWFSCKAVGDLIEKRSAQHPGKKITVLCGHTHGRGWSQITDDIEVYTGGADYYLPEVQGTFAIADDGTYVKEPSIRLESDD